MTTMTPRVQTHYVGKWCFDESLRNMRDSRVEVVCAYGNRTDGYYVEWQFDKTAHVYNLYYAAYENFGTLQHAIIVLTVETYQDLVSYCLWSSE